MSAVWLVVVFLSGPMLTTNAWSQTRHGAVEIGLSGSLSGTRSGGTGSPAWLGVLSFSSGYFFSRVGEIGLDFSLTTPEGQVGYGSVGAFGTAHFPHSEDSQVVPFIGAQLGSRFEGGHSTEMGIYGGFKGFLTRGAAIIVRPYYQRHKDNGTLKEEYGVLTGLSVFLG